MTGVVLKQKSIVARQQRLEALISLKNVTKAFQISSGLFYALKDVSLQIQVGQMVAITGKSGSGKSTLLNMMTGIDRPTRGEVSVDGEAVHELPEGLLARWRGRTIGIVFQFFQLLPTLTIIENIMLPMDFCRLLPRSERKKRALELLSMVGIEDQAEKFPSALSGGEQQRASIARALANDPPILVADEPTGNLDTHTAGSIFDLLVGLTEKGKTVVVVTHEKEFSKYFDEIISLQDGVILSPSNSKTAGGEQ